MPSRAPGFSSLTSSREEDRGPSRRCQPLNAALSSKRRHGTPNHRDEGGPHGSQGRSAGEAVRGEGAGSDRGARTPERRRLEEDDVVGEMDGRRGRAPSSPPWVREERTSGGRG